MTTRLGPTRSPVTAAAAPAAPIKRWPTKTARLTMLAPGSIRASASAAENSDSASQPRVSTSSRCIQAETPPPKLERPILEKSRNKVAAPALEKGGAAETSARDFMERFPWFLRKTPFSTYFD